MATIGMVEDKSVVLQKALDILKLLVVKLLRHGPL